MSATDDQQSPARRDPAPPGRDATATIVSHAPGEADTPRGSDLARATLTSSASSPTSSDELIADLLYGLTKLCEGDFSTRMSSRISARDGVAGEVVRRFDELAASQERHARELARVSKVIRRDGRLTLRMEEMGTPGGWSDMTQAVNSLIDDLARPTHEVARVIAAVAEGDLSQHMALEIAGQPVRGEFLRIGTTVNTMVDQLSSFADEVTRVAREVGTEGNLGGQAKVKGVSGVWRDLTESVNSMAGNLTSQVRNIAQVTTAVAQGDLSQKITVDARGEIHELKSTVNTMVDQLSAFADEVTRMAKEVGTEGKLGGQAQVKGVSGVWRDLTDSVNVMAGNLTTQVRSIAEVAAAVARGDLTRQITVDARGEVAELEHTLNTMVDQLSSFADEVTRVAREVGTEGALGGQAHVRGVSGVWRDLTESVNSMAGNLTSQVRNIALVATAVARGDLSQKITVPAQGEIAELKDTVNTMVDQLSSFAAEITRVGWEVGVEGKLGGQATVAGVAGTWKDLTDNVNQLASTLTIQLRAIGDVSTAVTRGDLTRSITVEAEGEVAELKDNINQMIARLRETTEVNAQQDWLKSNLARIGSKMQGQRDLYAVCQMIISEMTPAVNAQQGTVYLLDFIEGDKLRYVAGYGSVPRRRSDGTFLFGEGLIGQAALERNRIRVEHVPAGYLNIRSGLGEAPPCDLVVVPVVFENQVLGVIELASFTPFSELHLILVDQLVDTIGVVLNTIMANARTEELLAQSQRLTQELRSQSVELQRTNNELEEKAQLLEDKNREIELARIGLEEKAEQLALSSQYKTEFLANMSHELRTPLNSLLILAKLLADNPDRNLSQKQIDFAETIHSAGTELLGLINDILDLSKVEAGKMDVDATAVRTGALCDAVATVFGPIANEKSLAFEVSLAPDVPAEFVTDEQRLQQVLKNLLSNAVKFTDSGSVRLDVTLARPDLPHLASHLRSAGTVLSFAVSDTGIGIAAEKLRMIFEAFQQADGTTSRRYGGTGLGLSISKEIARLLGGSIAVSSAVGRGSTFTLYLPTVPLAQMPAFGVTPGEPDDVLMIVGAPDGPLGRGGEAGGSVPAIPGSGPAGGMLASSNGVHGPRPGVSGDAPAAGRGGTGVAGDSAIGAAPGDAAAAGVNGSGADGAGDRVGVPETFISSSPGGSSPTAGAASTVGAQGWRPSENTVGTPFLTGPADAGGRAPADSPDGSDPLVGTTVLVVDDDVRNVFALTSALEMYGMRVLYADNGHDAIRTLQQDTGPVHLVLMDVMLPGMDGNETTSMIRDMSAFAELPILVLTAKAMPGDRDKSITAGASDYITKPVDLDHLLGVMRSYLC
ncbi:Histidine kinase [Frankia canadensis]|uniref:Circadian input-output histidine kinase CikA n=1 Tax=Frankia canadensis TaxID=1836972 RepID=A0A2I2KX96_9ACTN|nr:HAMP domain-containing protein [Frankia canadensis]SNQ50279.1 Histidine kinase [Frankia canadensis]SOU57569.1 Histidine kinase [Frankia canadensis]